MSNSRRPKGDISKEYTQGKAVAFGGSCGSIVGAAIGSALGPPGAVLGAIIGGALSGAGTSAAWDANHKGVMQLSDGRWIPEPGYKWLNPDDDSDRRVIVE